MKYHYFPINIDASSVVRLGKQMTTNTLDQPITLRQLLDALEGDTGRAKNTKLDRVARRLREEATTTDFIRIDGGSDLNPVYRVAEQPTRRVQVGDLVTVGADHSSPLPRVARVTETNVAKPFKTNGLVAVAISPEDAKRIEAAIGKVPSGKRYDPFPSKYLDNRPW